MNHTLTLLFLIAKIRDAHPSISMVHPGMEEERQFLAMFSNGQSERESSHVVMNDLVLPVLWRLIVLVCVGM